MAINKKKLFRGKYGDDWIYGSLLEADGESFIGSTEKEFNTTDTIFRTVKPESVCEYTGLDDADGIHIFEGDILQFGAYKVAVFWNDEQFQWQARKHLGCYVKCPDSNWDYMELGLIAAEPIVTGQMTTKVIGNTFDDPGFYGEVKNDESTTWDF